MFLKLTQIIKGYEDMPVWVQSDHIVAIYPDRQGNGCHIELVTNSDSNESILHVANTADQVGQSCGPWDTLSPPTK